MRSTVHRNVMIGLASIISISLGGCGASGLGGIRGPSAVLQSTDVLRASGNTKLIIDALARDNNIPTEGFYTSPLYYDVAIAGFNFIDDQCAAYFDKLFYVQRDRQFSQQVLQAGNAATGAILALTGASTVTFGVVASAFGFSSALVDSVAGSFLFQLPPATTYGFVRELQTAYRSGVKAAEVQSPSAAYHVMQDYLAICLPPNIEARLVERVANTKALPQSPVGSNASPSIRLADRFVQQTSGRVGGGVAPQASRQIGGTAQAGAKIQPKETVVKPRRPQPASAPPEMAQFILAYDPARDSLAYVREIFKKLCAPDFPGAGQDRSEWVEKVKALIRIYENTPQFDENDAKPVIDGQIDEREGRTILASAACSPHVHNYFEKKTFDDGPPDAGFITALFKVLGEPIPEHLDKISLDQLRPKIREANTKLGLSNPTDFISDQYTPDLEAKLAEALKQ